MIISATVIRKPRKQRQCPMCRTEIFGKTIRLFGCADIGDKPYPMYLHPSCASSDDGGEVDHAGDTKIKKAISESNRVISGKETR